MNFKPLFLLCGALGAYLLLLSSNPVRAALRDGVRAMRRYPALWFTLGAFGSCYAIFQLALRIYFHNVLPPASRPIFIWAREAWRDPNLWLTGSPQSLWHLTHADFIAALRDAIIPAIENLAGIFNTLVPTFPVSAIAAVLLLINWNGHHGELWRALRSRFGRLSWSIHLAIIACAFAAIAKPFVYGVPQFLELRGAPPSAHLAWFQWSPIIVWLSFLFEYLLGVAIQIYLILLAFTWVRGMTFSHTNLVDFSIRRLSYVVKWAAIIMLLSTLFIDAPLFLKNFPRLQHFFPENEIFESRLVFARLALSSFILLTATMQIMLTFHNESWRAAMRDHWRFVKRRWWPLGWFLLLAGIHLFALHAADIAVRRGVGEGTALWVTWSLLFPWIVAAASGWLLASWVSLFRRCETRAPSSDAVKF